MIDLLPSYKEVLNHAVEAKAFSLKSMFDSQANRFDDYSIQGPHLFLDYSKNLINKESIGLLIKLLSETDFSAKQRALFNGSKVNDKQLNATENRQVLHTALRLPSHKLLSRSPDDLLPSEAIRDDVYQCRTRIYEFINRVHNGSLKGYTDKPLKSIVSIGIGGSFLGPKMVTKALSSCALEGFSCHYIANIDGADFNEVIKKINLEETVFLLQSKSFGTVETISNANAVKAFMTTHGLNQEQMAKHFYAVTSNVEKAVAFGLEEDNIFPMWDWVGGRYSLWSAIGIPIAFLIGSENFERLLQGAHDMDQHFLNADFDKNIPVILALLGIWYQNFFSADSHAVLPYSHYLRYLPHHLQQLDMESNGKQVAENGKQLSFNTGPIVWGGEGTNGQHAYHQLLHQGTHFVPCDFLIGLKADNELSEHHKLLAANCFSQSKALMEGKTYQQALDELIASGLSQEASELLAPHRVYPGNRPSNTIAYQSLSPEVVGALVAAYEHKVFVQGVVWGINSFDQWGVELGKTLGDEIFNMLNENTPNNQTDASTKGLIDSYIQANKL